MALAGSGRPFPHEREMTISRPCRSLTAAGAIALAALLAGASEAQAQGSVSTDDGLSVSLSASGAVTRLLVDGVDHASARLPSGFTFRELPAEAADVVPNGSFESGSGSPAAWSWTDDAAGTWVWNSGVSSQGNRSMRVNVPGPSAKRSPPLISADFPIRPNTPYRFSCRMRTEGLSSALNFFVFERDATGVLVRRQVSSGSGTNDWATRELTFTSGPTAVSGYFRGEIFSGSGTAWLDQVEMLDLFAGRTPSSFGGQIAPTANGGFTQTAAAEGLNLTASFVNVGNAIQVDATLSDVTGRDRAVELSFGLPIELSGAFWEQNPVTTRAIFAGTRYENLDTASGAQAHSLYPFATIRNAEAALTLATPMVPQMNRFTYDLETGFRLTWDLGLSAAAIRTPSRATIRFWIYSQETRWGFRSAAQKYGLLAPNDFVSAYGGADSGAWVIPAGGESIQSVAGFRDFGWQFYEGIADVAFANANRISVMHYVDPSGYFRLFPGYTTQPDYDVLVSSLEADAAKGTGTLQDGVPRSEMARATIASSPWNEEGRYQLFPSLWYGDRLQIYPASPDPDIPAPSLWNVLTRYNVDGRLEWARERDYQVDGIFLDDLTSTMAAIENYRRDLWAYSDAPLTFSWKTQRVMLLDGFSMAEFCAGFPVRGPPKIPSAHGQPESPRLRVVCAAPGRPRGRGAGSGVVRKRLRPPRARRGPPLEQSLCSSRQDSLRTAAEVLAYLRQALLLGYFPGFNGAYWTEPSAYERDRHLFRMYIPLIRTVVAAAAGDRSTVRLPPTRPSSLNVSMTREEGCST